MIRDCDCKKGNRYKGRSQSPGLRPTLSTRIVMPSPHCEHVNCEYPAVKHQRREEFALWLRMGKDTFALLHHSLDIELCFKSENCNFKLDIIKKSKNDTWAPWYWERANFPSIYWELGRFIDDHEYFIGDM